MNEQATTTTDNGAAATAAIGFNPFDPAFREDPYPTYQRLLQGEPIREGMMGVYVVPHYADCVALLRDPKSSQDQRNSDQFKEFIAQQPQTDANLEMLERRPFLFMDARTTRGCAGS